MATIRRGTIGSAQRSGGRCRDRAGQARSLAPCSSFRVPSCAGVRGSSTRSFRAAGLTPGSPIVSLRRRGLVEADVHGRVTVRVTFELRRRERQITLAMKGERGPAFGGIVEADLIVSLRVGHRHVGERLDPIVVSTLDVDVDAHGGERSRRRAVGDLALDDEEAVASGRARATTAQTGAKTGTAVSWIAARRADFVRGCIGCRMEKQQPRLSFAVGRTPDRGSQRARRDASSSIECASFTSSAVTPPASWVLRSMRTVFQTLNHSG